MSEFVIRPATAEDEPALVELEHESAIHHAGVDPQRWRVPSKEAVAAYRRRRREEDPEARALVAVVGERVIGLVEVLPRAGIDYPGAARVPFDSVDIGLSVTPEWRDRGVGTALMEAAEAWARERGAARMILDIAAANTGARRLYERLGYETHALIMDKALEPGSGGDRSPQVAVLPMLEGEMVRLRPLVAADRAALVEVLSDPTVVEWWDTRGPENSADELVAGEPGWHVFAIEVDGRFAGSIQATEEPDGDYRHAGIDIFMSAPFQGRGIGTDAVRTLARWLIEERGHHRLTIDPAASNARAIRAYEKVGFKPVGVMRRYERGVDGTYHDGLLMDMLAGELR